MKAKNYNANPRRAILIQLLAGSMTIEQIGNLLNPTSADEEAKVRHTLACLRVEGLIEDSGEDWAITQGGRNYAEWCRSHPQVYRRARSPFAHPPAAPTIPPAEDRII